MLVRCHSQQGTWGKRASDRSKGWRQRRNPTYTRWHGATGIGAEDLKSRMLHWGKRKKKTGKEDRDGRELKTMHHAKLLVFQIRERMELWTTGSQETNRTDRRVGNKEGTSSFKTSSKVKKRLRRRQRPKTPLGKRPKRDYTLKSHWSRFGNKVRSQCKAV